MKTYLFACTSAALASAAIALWSQDDSAAAFLPARTPHAALVASQAPSRRGDVMARRPEARWLLRAMSESAPSGTLVLAPDEPRTRPPFL